MWVLLLFLLPFTGLGPLPCLSLATVLTVALVVWAERRRGRRLREAAAAEAGGGAEGARPERGPMSAGTAVALTLGAVALLVYVIFVIRAA